MIIIKEIKRMIRLALLLLGGIMASLSSALALSYSFSSLPFLFFYFCCCNDNGGLNGLNAVSAMKIAFVGDSGLGDDAQNYGYGDYTMDMLDALNVDLVIDHGDFDYWGKCTELYQIQKTKKNGRRMVVEATEVVPTGSTRTTIELRRNTLLKRYNWQYNDPITGTPAGWEIGIEKSRQQQQDDDDDEEEIIIMQPQTMIDIPMSRLNSKKRRRVSSLHHYKWSPEDDDNSYAGDDDDDETQFQRYIVSHSTWTKKIEPYLQLQSHNPIGSKRKTRRRCHGEPWYGPYWWSAFISKYNFDFLASSGNFEVLNSDGGSANIWISHQKYMYQLYIDKIYNTNKGTCYGYFNNNNSNNIGDHNGGSTMEEYGERYSCFYKIPNKESRNRTTTEGGGANANTYGDNENNDVIHFLMLGWKQGSNERNGIANEMERNHTIQFIEREFESSERSQYATNTVKWKFCVTHMTSAKLSAGDKNRDQMEHLSRITDLCRKYGAILISGHHHLYSRTELLTNVGGPSGTEDIQYIGPTFVTSSNSINSSTNTSYSSNSTTTMPSYTITEGTTMSITTGMSGYDSTCTGQYWNASWMNTCITSHQHHRGAVIMELLPSSNTNNNNNNNNIAKFQYLNSITEPEYRIEDEFQIISQYNNNNINRNRKKK